MNAVELRDLYNRFLKEFPLESLKDMPLEKYTNLNKDDSFCYWLETKTEALGYVWGKAGIYRYVQKPADKKAFLCDDEYAWYTEYGHTAQEAYDKVRDLVTNIATFASKQDFASIDNLTNLYGSAIEWKIAFFYSNEHLLPILKREDLETLAAHFGAVNPKQMKTSEIQRLLLDNKGDKDLFEYYIELKEILEAHTVPKPSTEPIPPNPSVESYTKADFLREVYMSEASFDTLCQLVKTKKNVILQGAPGVGKTFCAHRLAQAMMGVKDNSRIELIQFHQNYAYEDFVMGYKPEGDTFKLKEGVFYRFCKRAASDPKQDYFFIIDEINRGNLSKIFGELLMLIENDYRGEAVTLAYRDERFFVPRNLYLIGMMNTADRSLALIDYALRRRFSFFEMHPAFDSEGFKAYMKEKDNARLNELVEQLKVLNREIAGDASLGSGFEIGHSYLCTNKAVTDKWLKAVVYYDILPMLQEYWFDNADKVKEWTNRLGGIFHD